MEFSFPTSTEGFKLVSGTYRVRGMLTGEGQYVVPHEYL